MLGSYFGWGEAKINNSNLTRLKWYLTCSTHNLEKSLKRYTFKWKANTLFHPPPLCGCP